MRQSETVMTESAYGVAHVLRAVDAKDSKSSSRVDGGLRDQKKSQTSSYYPSSGDLGRQASGDRHLRSHITNRGDKEIPTYPQQYLPSHISEHPSEAKCASGSKHQNTEPDQIGEVVPATNSEKPPKGNGSGKFSAEYYQ